MKQLEVSSTKYKNEINFITNRFTVFILKLKAHLSKIKIIIKTS